MKKKNFIVAAILFSSQLNAQQDSLVHILDEVTVTATKSAIKLSQTGKVITILDRSILDRSAGKDLSQLLTEQAALVINGATSNPGKDKSVFLRGAKNDYTVILINGIAVTDPSGVTGAFDMRMIPIEEIDRIEIVKGAQSTLYGSNAIAGVINIITKKGSSKAFQSYGNVSAGTYQTLNANVGISGRIPGFSYDLGYMHRQSNGISEAKDTTRSKIFDKDAMNENGFYSRFETEIAKKIILRPFFRYQHFNGDYDDGAFTDAPDKFRSSLLTAGTSVTIQFGKTEMTGQFQYDKVSRFFTSTYGNYPFEGRSKTAELYATTHLLQHLDLLAGIDYRDQQSLDSSSIPKNPKVNIVSPYVALYLKALHGLNIELGTRYNRHSKYGDNYTYSFNPSYLINGRFKIFTNIATAFRTPSLNELFGPYGSNAALRPEKSKTYEAGFQAGFKTFDIRFAGFIRRTKDIIIYGPSFSYINLDKQRDHGFEIEPGFHWGNKLRLNLYYAYTTGNVTTSLVTKDTVYNNLLRRPKNSLGITAGLQLGSRLFISTSLYNYGKRGDLFFDNSTFSSVPVTLRGYALWNFYGEFTLVPKKLKVFADLKNITGTRYEEVYGYSTQGFSFMAGISFKL